MSQYYITTPIYYVNDRPHIGHLYTTAVADILARAHRLRGHEVHFLTGTDEHAPKVAESAEARGVAPLAWADQTSRAFREAFAEMDLVYDDFIRTTEERHRERVRRYVRQLLDSDDVYRGQYEGWYDASQEEYVPEAKAKDADYRSTVNGKPLVRKSEENYFFRLSRYGAQLQELLESGEFDVRPKARRNEVLGRVREGLNDIPMSRTGSGGWGIPMPGDPEHVIYVWVDALFNYLTAVDTDEQRRFWPADVQLIGKDILWFHAVIWPALLLALSRHPGNEWMRLPKLLYAHSWWIREGQKMSKSLGNFLDLEQLLHYRDAFSLDAVRYFLASNGPLGTNDSDFAESLLLEVYNADLANTLGNCLSRTTQMIHRYCGGRVPRAGTEVEGSAELRAATEKAVGTTLAAWDAVDLAGACEAALRLIKKVDGFIDATRPFQLAKDEAKAGEVATILYHCAEALRVASLLLWPVLPAKAEELWARLGCGSFGEALANLGRGDLTAWARWGGLAAGTEIHKGPALFPRIDDPPEIFTQETPAMSESPATPSAEVPSQGSQSDKEAAPKAADKTPAKTEPGADEISIDQFFDTVLRVGTILAAEPVPKSNKLMRVQVRLSEDAEGVHEERTIVAGIAKEYSSEELLGRQVVVVANLKPAKLMGVESQGMILAASIDGKPGLIQPEAPVPDGTRVR